MSAEIDLALEKYRRFNDQNLARLVRTVEKYITNQISRELHVHGYVNLSARHLQVFENLDTEGVSIVQLAHRAGISKQAMSKMVKEVAREGFVDVVTDDRDNRVQLVNVTQKGANLIGDIRRQTSYRCNELLTQKIVSREELEQATNTFAKLLNHFETVGFNVHFAINLN
ncbi:MAG: MarR family winged helix-turn-helix transcriptional regulator [Saprospiraceae bacterium]|nr:MarR family winged helix-turn-helix transcriptional regulator [Saprospiraceae bacterium]